MTPGTWRIYFLPVTISHFTVLVFSYFGVVMHWKKWLQPILLVGVPVSVALLAAFVLAVWPGEQIGSTVNTAAADFILYVLGAITTGIALAAMAIVLYVTRGFDEDEYSNPADFPVVSTRRRVGFRLAQVLLYGQGEAAGISFFRTVRSGRRRRAGARREGRRALP